MAAESEVYLAIETLGRCDGLDRILTPSSADSEWEEFIPSSTLPGLLDSWRANLQLFLSRSPIMGNDHIPACNSTVFTKRLLPEDRPTGPYTVVGETSHL